MSAIAKKFNSTFGFIPIWCDAVVVRRGKVVFYASTFRTANIYAFRNGGKVEPV